MKKFLSIATSALLVLAISLTGCSKGNAEKSTSESNNSKVTLQFWAGCITSDRDAVYKNYVQAVSQKYPNITINYLGVPGDWSAYKQKLDMAISAGTAPDITNYFIASHISDGFYFAIDNYFNKWADKKFINNNIQTSVRNYDQKSHKLYGMPYSTQMQIFWARTDWLKNANLSAPTTWDDFFSDVQKLTDKSQDKYGYSIRGGSGSASNLEFLMYDYSGITNYFDKNGKSTINDPKNVEFCNKYFSMYNVYTPQDDLTKSWTQLASTFQSGKAAFIQHNLGSGSAMAKAFNNDYSKFEAIPFPKSIKGYVVHSALQPNALSISSTSKYKQQAFDALTVFVTKDMQVSYSKVYGEMPANSESTSDEFFKSTPYMQVGANLINSSSTEFSDTPYYLPDYASIQSKIEPMIQQVMTKQITVQAMLNQWADLLTKSRATYEASIKSSSKSSSK